MRFTEAERAYLEFTAHHHVEQYKNEMQHFGFPSFELLDTLHDIADKLAHGEELEEGWWPESDSASEELVGWLNYTRNNYRQLYDEVRTPEEKEQAREFINVQSAIIRKLQIKEVK